MNSKSRKKGILFAVIGPLLWGVSGTCAEYLFQEKGFSSGWLVLMRLLIAGSLLLLISIVKKDQNVYKIWTTKNDSLKLILFSLLGMLGVQYTYFAAINYGNAATATILQYLSPIVITCYVAIKGKTLPKPKQLIAILFAMTGTFLIITKGNLHSLSISKLALFWGIASAFTSALYTLQPISLISKYGSTVVVGYGMFIGGIGFSFIQSPFDSKGSWDIYSLLAIIFVIIFGTLVGFLCYLDSLKYILPTEAAILGSLEPLSAAVLSVLYLNNSLNIYQWIGTFCIIFTIGFLSYSKDK